MIDARFIALAALAAAVAATPSIADAVTPVPPLPDPKQHNDGWNAAWSTIIAERPLGTARKRAVTLAQLATEQSDQIGSPSHADESAWLEAWITAYKAGNGADYDAFGPIEGAGTKGGGEGFFGNTGNDVIQAILDGEEPDIWGLSPLGDALKTMGAQWRRVVADAVGNGVPWIEGGNPNEVTINGTRAAIVNFAKAMDAAEEPYGFFGKVGLLFNDAVSAGAGAIGDAVGSALNGALSGVVGAVAPYAIAGGIVYLAVRK